MYLIFFLTLLGAAVFFFRAYIRPLWRENDLKRQYQSAAEPRLMCQVGEEDDEFYARVERERLRFRESGNNWALKQTPVIAMWRNRAFTITWYGKEYDYSTVGLSQMDYHRFCLEAYIQLYEVHSRETGRFTEPEFAQAFGQKPFTQQNVWQKATQ